MISIIDFLNYGEENSKSQEELTILTGLSQRELRATIYHLRCKGALILSNSDRGNGGYYLPKNNEEIRRYIAFQKSRINSAKEAIKGAEEFLKKGGFENGTI